MAIGDRQPVRRIQRLKADAERNNREGLNSLNMIPFP
jgi:hypothetical protein